MIKELTDMIRRGEPFTFVKRGDGEQLCMDGAEGCNCDGHPYSPELAARLREAFAFFEFTFFETQSNVRIVEFADQAAYNSLLHRTDSDLAAVKAFWGAVRESERRKLFVGPIRLSKAAKMLHAEHIWVPKKNVFGYYSLYEIAMRYAVHPGDIVIFCAGMTAKPLIAEVMQRLPDVTCIDAGSAFDPLCVEGGTRTEQLSMDVLNREYREWLT